MVIGMDGLESKMVNLDEKVDKIYHKVEELSYQIRELAWLKTQTSEASGEVLASGSPIMPPYSNNSVNFQSVMMEHKDIIADGTDLNGTDGDGYQEQTISTDIQITRLTAQLTAAYNRIAALEEQLLARRIHS